MRRVVVGALWHVLVVVLPFDHVEAEAADVVAVVDKVPGVLVDVCYEPAVVGDVVYGAQHLL